MESISLAFRVASGGRTHRMASHGRCFPNSRRLFPPPSFRFFARDFWRWHRQRSHCSLRFRPETRSTLELRSSRLPQPARSEACCRLALPPASIRWMLYVMNKMSSWSVVASEAYRATIGFRVRIRKGRVDLFASTVWHRGDHNSSIHGRRFDTDLPRSS